MLPRGKGFPRPRGNEAPADVVHLNPHRTLSFRGEREGEVGVRAAVDRPKAHDACALRGSSPFLTPPRRGVDQGSGRVAPDPVAFLHDEEPMTDVARVDPAIRTEVGAPRLAHIEAAILLARYLLVCVREEESGLDGSGLVAGVDQPDPHGVVSEKELV